MTMTIEAGVDVRPFTIDTRKETSRISAGA